MQYWIWTDIFPWSSHPVSVILAPVIPLIQAASLLGGWGVCFLAYGFNVLIATALYEGGKWKYLAIVIFTSLWLISGFWQMSLHQPTQAGKQLKVGLLLDDVGPTAWSEDNGDRRARRIIERAETFGAAGLFKGEDEWDDVPVVAVQLAP